MRISVGLVISVIFAFIVSYIIYLINISLRNPVEICLQISSMLFLNIFAVFIAYFIIRSMFSKRWTTWNHKTPKINNEFVKKSFYFPLIAEKINKIKQNINIINEEPNNSSILAGLFKAENTENEYNPLEWIEKTKIWKKNGIYCEYTKPIKKNTSKNNDIIVFLHGMESNCRIASFFINSFAFYGYNVLSFDARGAEEGRTKIGKKARFLSRGQDLKQIVIFLSQLRRDKLFEGNIHLVGESMGGFSAVQVAFDQECENLIGKICTISIGSNFKKMFNKHLFPLSRDAILRFHYRTKYINPYPPDEPNNKISPYFIIEFAKNHYKGDWNSYINSKFLLIHAKNDSIFKIRNFYENKNIAELSENNVILFNSGAHNQIQNELAILSSVINFLNQNNIKND